jgi:hypothetical protein
MTEYAYSRRHREYGSDEIPETCPAEIRARIIERRAAKRSGKPSRPAVAAKPAPQIAPAFKPGRLLRPTL